MRIVDANTGQDLQVGVPFTNVDGVFVILKVRGGLFSADALVQRILAPPDDPTIEDWPAGRQHWVPLVVRYTHPHFFLRRVAFLSS